MVPMKRSGCYNTAVDQYLKGTPIIKRFQTQPSYPVSAKVFPLTSYKSILIRFHHITGWLLNCEGSAGITVHIKCWKVAYVHGLGETYLLPTKLWFSLQLWINRLWFRKTLNILLYCARGKIFTQSQRNLIWRANIRNHLSLDLPAT